MTSCPWTSRWMTEPVAQEFKLLKIHGKMRDGPEKKIEHFPNERRRQEGKVEAHPVHNSLTVAVCGVIYENT